MGYHAEFGPSGSNGLGLIKGVGKKLRGAGPINPSHGAWLDLERHPPHVLMNLVVL